MNTVSQLGAVLKAAWHSPAEAFFIFFPVIVFVVAVPVWLGISQVNPILALVGFVISTAFLTVFQWVFQTIMMKLGLAGPPVRYPLRPPIGVILLSYVLNLAVFIMPFFAIYLIAAFLSAR